MKVNGEIMELNKGMTLKALLDEMGYDERRIAVEHNERIVPKEEYGTLALNDSDVIEIVMFMGGGCGE